MNIPSTIEAAKPILIAFSLKVLGAIAAYIVGRMLIGFASTLVVKGLERQKVEPTVIRYIGSIITVALNIILVVAILGYFGVETTSFAALVAGLGIAETFQFLFSAAFICYACAYLVMFAIPLVARGEKPSWIVRLAALSGFLMTLLFVVLSVFPIVTVQNSRLFTAKLIAVVGGFQCAGAAYYWWTERARSVPLTRTGAG